MTTLTKENKLIIAQELSVLLSSMYMLFIKTQNFHWNVKGPHFESLHSLFEAQYNDLFEANDEVAERIRALDVLSPGNMKSFQSLSILQESDNTLPANTMVETLLSNHESIASLIRDIIKKAADVNDEGTVDMLGSRLAVHEKTAWMLRSFLA